MEYDTDILLEIVKIQELGRCEWKSEFFYKAHSHNYSNENPGAYVTYYIGVGGQHRSVFVKKPKYKKFIRDKRLKELGI